MYYLERLENKKELLEIYQKQNMKLKKLDILMKSIPSFLKREMMDLMISLEMFLNHLKQILECLSFSEINL